jgi:crotonobetainyl-CoA:carnitine CoA-transferase CaiB-like acyl-CoA transferase
LPPATGFRLASGDTAPELPPPALGAHTEEVLAEIGLSAADIAELRTANVI